jgi:hypothetical protein
MPRYGLMLRSRKYCLAASSLDVDVDTLLLCGMLEDFTQLDEVFIVKLL